MTEIDMQQVAVDYIRSGKSLMLTGGAGRGKSHVIRGAVTPRTVLCAPFGIAALNIGGETTTSVFGLPVGGIIEEDWDAASRNFKELFSDDFVNRIVIDEWSTLRADMADLIDYKLRKIRNVDEPFGGIQVVFVGDGLQLPPVVLDEEKRKFRTEYKSPYFFSSRVWQEMVAKGLVKAVVLTKSYRQSEGHQVALLDAIRTKSKHYKMAVKRLNEWCPAKLEGVDPIVLCNYNADADKINKDYFDSIDGQELQCVATIKGNFKKESCLVPEILKLKIGCRVMICANDQDGFYKNGQLGVLTQADASGTMVLIDGDKQPTLIKMFTWENVKHVKGMGGLVRKIDGEMTQLPLRIGKALSVHKSQGLSLDHVEVNLGNKCFAPHQAYVAISRVRNLKNMALTRPIREDDIKIDKKVARFYDSLGDIK